GKVIEQASTVNNIVTFRVFALGVFRGLTQQTMYRLMDEFYPGLDATDSGYVVQFFFGVIQRFLTEIKQRDIATFDTATSPQYALQFYGWAAANVQNTGTCARVFSAKFSDLLQQPID